MLQIKCLELKPLFKYVLRKQFASRQVKCLFLIAYSQVYVDTNRITGNHMVSLSHLGKIVQENLYCVDTFDAPRLKHLGSP